MRANAHGRPNTKILRAQIIIVAVGRLLDLVEQGAVADVEAFGGVRAVAAGATATMRTEFLGGTASARAAPGPPPHRPREQP